ncbi:hypothetical protein [Chryseobacterium sp.]|uniref:hypothetical protein n=1 Tax=Chryseobacterium sp. TaxID=1871047 RepID=UPI0025BD25B9|nr:hypothetical protein [Chryseobacterium sp.]MBV8326382.1 hypothetical protein [Chryseobacterium sp.]
MKYYFELRKEKINRDGMIPIRLIVMNAKTRIRKSVEANTLNFKLSQMKMNNKVLIRNNDKLKSECADIKNDIVT